MKQDYIKIKRISINGLRHSQVNLEGRFYSHEKQELIVYADGEKIKSNIKMIGKIGKFVLSAPITKKMKKIEIKIKIDSNEELICSIKNSLFTKIVPSHWPIFNSYLKRKIKHLYSKL